MWFNLSWLWDALASATFEYAGFRGLVLFAVACGAAIVGYLTAICLGYGAPPAAVCISVFLAGLLYPVYEASPNVYLAASPNTCTMLFCVVFYRECLRRTRWFVLPALMTLWANLHGGFLLGFVVIGVFFAAALLRRAWAELRIFALAGITCVDVLLSQHGNAGQHSRPPLHAGLRRARATLSEFTAHSARAAIDVLAVPDHGTVPVQVYRVLLHLLDRAIGAASRQVAICAAHPS
jgi:hypothetical protein